MPIRFHQHLFYWKGFFSNHKTATCMVCNKKTKRPRWPFWKESR